MASKRPGCTIGLHITLPKKCKGRSGYGYTEVECKFTNHHSFHPDTRFKGEYTRSSSLRLSGCSRTGNLRRTRSSIQREIISECEHKCFSTYAAVCGAAPKVFY